MDSSSEDEQVREDNDNDNGKDNVTSEIIIARDYSRGTLTQFDTTFPSQFNKRVLFFYFHFTSTLCFYSFFFYYSLTSLVFFILHYFSSLSLNLLILYFIVSC